MSIGEQDAMMNTRHGAPADAVRVLRRSWPHLPWSGVHIAQRAGPLSSIGMLRGSSDRDTCGLRRDAQAIGPSQSCPAAFIIR